MASSMATFGRMEAEIVFPLLTNLLIALAVVTVRCTAARLSFPSLPCFFCGQVSRPNLAAEPRSPAWHMVQCMVIEMHRAKKPCIQCELHVLLPCTAPYAMYAMGTMSLMVHAGYEGSIGLPCIHKQSIPLVIIFSRHSFTQGGPILHAMHMHHTT